MTSKVVRRLEQLEAEIKPEKGDILTVTGTSGPDTVRLSRQGDEDLTITWTAGANSGTVRVKGFGEVDVLLGGGADSLTVDDLEGSSVKTVRVDVGQNITVVGTRLVTDRDSG